MGISAVYDAAGAALMLAAKLAAPIVIAALVVGVVVSFLQSMFQLNEPTLSFVPKAAVVGVVLVAMAPTIGTSLVDLFEYMLLLATR